MGMVSPSNYYSLQSFLLLGIKYPIGNGEDTIQWYFILKFHINLTFIDTQMKYDTSFVMKECGNLNIGASVQIPDDLDDELQVQYKCTPLLQ